MVNRWKTAVYTDFLSYFYGVALKNYNLLMWLLIINHKSDRRLTRQPGLDNCLAAKGEKDASIAY